MSSKSANYCFASRLKDIGLLLLSEVGKEHIYGLQFIIPIFPKKSLTTKNLSGEPSAVSIAFDSSALGEESTDGLFCWLQSHPILGRGWAFKDLLLCRQLQVSVTSYWRPTQRQKDYFRANTAPKDWARWLPILQAPSLCKYSELGQIGLYYLCFNF